MLRLGAVAPYLSVTVLQRTGDDPDIDFDVLRRFLRRTASDRGRALEARVQAESSLFEDDAPDVGQSNLLGQHGFTGLYGVSRVVSRRPSWAEEESGLVDTVNELTVAVWRNDLVAVYTDITTEAQFRYWVDKELAPFRFVSTDTFTGAFRGDGRMVWTRGVHRRRTTKADSKSLGGLRIQDALDPIDDGSFALTAAKIDYRPADDNAILRNAITFSGKSRVSWKKTASFAEFLAALSELLDALEKTLAAGSPPEELFPPLAVPETDLTKVHAAFDVMVTDPDEVRAQPNADDDRVARALLLRDTLLEVRGDPTSAKAYVDVGHGGSVAGTLTLTPGRHRDGFVMEVAYAGTPSASSIARDIKDAIGSGDLLTVYYESGHAFTGHQISRQNLTDHPFPNFEWADFTGFAITKEKPSAAGDQAIHDSIDRNRDDSLFAWVARRYGHDWLLCDDGAGEVADFLHLDNNGTLTAIHVKAADKASANRRIAVARFEQVVSQAEKNIRLLDNDTLVDRLNIPRIANPAAWHAGRRVPSSVFVTQLATRVASDKTKVIIVQPHLLRAVHDQARAAAEAGQATRDSRSLSILDTLLHTTRRTVTSRWDDLTVIGCN